MLLIETIGTVAEGKWSDGVAQMMTHIGPEWRAAPLAVGIAAIAAGIGCIPAIQQRHPLRWHAVGASVVAVVAAVVLLVGSDLGPNGREDLGQIRQNLDLERGLGG